MALAMFPAIACPADSFPDGLADTVGSERHSALE